MDKVVVADIGMEGGGITIYGIRSDGAWSFWTEGTSIDLDENDHEVCALMVVGTSQQP